MIKIIILMLMAFPAQGQTLSVEDWYQKYSRPCKGLASGMVCRERLDASLKRMVESKAREKLEENGLPAWLATVGVIESGYNNKAVSKAGARGVFQLMMSNVQQYYTRTRYQKAPLSYSGKLKFTETIIETKPTIESCKWLAQDPDINMEVAFWLMRRLYNKYKDWSLALQAYNIGEPALDKHLRGERDLPFETRNYFFQLMAIQRYMEEKG